VGPVASSYTGHYQTNLKRRSFGILDRPDASYAMGCGVVQPAIGSIDAGREREFDNHIYAGRRVSVLELTSTGDGPWAAG
jgi:hypothetical protein